MKFNSYTDLPENMIKLLSFLEQDEVINNVPLGALNRIIANPNSIDQFFIYTVEKDGEILAYANWSPPHPIIFAYSEQSALEFLVDNLEKPLEEASGVQGLKNAIDIVLDRSQVVLESGIERRDKQGCYKLTEVIHPLQTHIKIKPAVSGDFDLLVKWYFEFGNECNLGTPALEVAEKWAGTKIKKEDVYLAWDGKTPVASALKGRRLPNGCSIGFVYTPNEHRNHGYASAVVANVSQLILNEGYNYSCLFTQLSNSTSNSIYQKIGYSWVDEFTHVFFKRK